MHTWGVQIIIADTFIKTFTLTIFVVVFVILCVDNFCTFHERCFMSCPRAAPPGVFDV
jgi:hypothetical protein